MLLYDALQVIAEFVPGVFSSAGDELKQLVLVSDETFVAKAHELLGMLHVSADEDETDQLVTYCLEGDEERAKSAITILDTRTDSGEKESVFKDLLFQLSDSDAMSVDNPNLKTVLTVRSPMFCGECLRVHKMSAVFRYRCHSIAFEF